MSLLPHISTLSTSLFASQVYSLHVSTFSHPDPDSLLSVFSPTAILLSVFTPRLSHLYSLHFLHISTLVPALCTSQQFLHISDDVLLWWWIVVVMYCCDDELLWGVFCCDGVLLWSRMQVFHTYLSPWCLFLTFPFRLRLSGDMWGYPVLTSAIPPFSWNSTPSNAFYVESRYAWGMELWKVWIVEVLHHYIQATCQTKHFKT